MRCPECSSRPAKRQCPALGRRICAPCCGTKRLVVIRCPDTCSYLASARQHPPVAERRQADADFQVLNPMAGNLSPGQDRLLSAFVAVVAGHPADPLTPLTDADVAEATGALAATYETAGRGVIYEHPTHSAGARRLAADLKGLLAELERRGRPGLTTDAAVVLRRLERAARESPAKLGGSDTAFLALLARVGRETPAETADLPDDIRPRLADPRAAGGSGIIVPGR